MNFHLRDLAALKAGDILLGVHNYKNSEIGHTYSIRLILEVTDANEKIEAKTVVIVRQVMSAAGDQDQLHVIPETKIYPKDGHGRILSCEEVDLEQWLTHKQGIYRLAGQELFQLRQGGFCAP